MDVLLVKFWSPGNKIYKLNHPPFLTPNLITHSIKTLSGYTFSVREMKSTGSAV